MHSPPPSKQGHTLRPGRQVGLFPQPLGSLPTVGPTPTRSTHIHPAATTQAGGTHTNEPTTMRMAQLPTTRNTRTTLLQSPQTRLRTSTRHRHTTRLRQSTQAREDTVGQGHSGRGHTNLQQMRQTNHKQRCLGPRTHRQPPSMDRTRTPQLQQTRRPSQEHRKPRTLETLTKHNSNHNKTKKTKHSQTTCENRKTSSHKPNQTPLGGNPNSRDRNRRRGDSQVRG